MQTSKNNTPTLYLIRHAQSTNNANPEPERIPDPPLTELGTQQAKALSTYVPNIQPTHLLTSPFLRTLQTTQPLAASTGLTPHIHAQLFEQGGCYSGYQAIGKRPEPGLRRKEIEEGFPGWHIDPTIDEQGWNKLPQYESTDMARDRANHVATWLQSEFHSRPVRILVVIHADFKLRLLESLLKRDDIEHAFGPVINTSITALRLEPSGWRLDTWNSHQHLPNQWITS